MNEIPWDRVVVQGILIQQSIQSSAQWQYCIPGLAETWSHPFSSEQSARKAAIVELLHRARIPIEPPPLEGRIVLHFNKTSTNPEHYISELKRQLDMLQMMEAALGTYWHDYLPSLIEQVRTFISIVESRAVAS